MLWLLLRRTIVENKELENNVEIENNEPEIKEEVVTEEATEEAEAEVVEEVAEETVEEESLTVAPVEEISDEEILAGGFIDKIKAKAKKVNWKKVWDAVATGLLFLLIAIPVLILAYVIITFFNLI